MGDGRAAGGTRDGAGHLRGTMRDIHLPVFEGPLDLLLHLIERDELDITAVSLVAVTDQYLAAVHTKDGVDPHALAEFVAIGAKLLYLKSKALLPVVPTAAGEEPEPDDVGAELVDLLMEYRRFREVADMLHDRQEAGLRLYPRLAPAPPIPPGPGLENVTVDRLYSIMLEVIARTPPPPQGAIVRETLTLSQRVQDLRATLRRQGRVSFRTMIMSCKTRMEIVISFMAILELLKAGECDAKQSDQWGDIDVVAIPAAKAAG
ncbi:MAG: segregation and condensation protein A [Tepidiformaceae bacterium]